MESFKAGYRSIARKFEGAIDVPNVVRAMYDVMDNVPYYAEPRQHNVDLESAADPDTIRENLIQTFLPDNYQDEVRDRFTEQGEFHYHDVVGKKAESARHGHRFVIDSQEDFVGLYFLDPEHMVGKKNFLRPQVCNVVALSIDRHDDAAVNMVNLRVRTSELADHELSFPELQSTAVHMLDEPGEYPSLVKTPKDISFYLRLNPEQAMIQSRYVGNKGIRAAVDGGTLPRFIYEKARMSQVVLNKFLKYDDQGIYKQRS